MDHAQRIKSILNELTSPLYKDNPFSTSTRGPEYQEEDDCNGLGFQAFYNRISTFSVRNWGADPNSAVYLAKYGFTNVSGCQVRCTSCGITVDLEVFRGKQDILATIATRSHKPNCRWSQLSTPRAYFQIPRNPLKAADDFMMKVKELLTFNYDIPEVQMPAIPHELLAVAKEGNPSEDLNSRVLTSATCMAACGWEKASESTFHCRFCRRNFSVWTFMSVGTFLTGEPSTRTVPNRVVSLIINHINSEETDETENCDTSSKLDDTPLQSEDPYSSESPLESKSSEKSESSSSDETTSQSIDDTSYMHFRRRLRSRSFFDVQASKRNALKILRQKACMLQKGIRCKTPTSSGGESGAEDLENSLAKDSEPRSQTGSESDASVIPVEGNKNVTSKNLVGIQQNGYPGIRFPEELLVTKSDSYNTMNVDNEVDLPNMNFNMSKSNIQLEPVCKDKVHKTDLVNSESARSYHLSGEDLVKTNSEDFISTTGGTNRSEELQRVHGNILGRDPENGTYPVHPAHNGGCFVLNTTTNISVSSGGVVFNSSATRDIGGNIHLQNYVYFGDPAFQQNVLGNTVQAQQPRTSSVVINQRSKLSRDPRINRVNNIPNIVPIQDNSRYHSNNHATNQEPVTFEEGQYEETYHNANYHGEMYCDGYYPEENQFTPVICSVIGNAVIPGDAIDNHMGVSSTPQKDKELSNENIVLLSGSTCEPEVLKDKCSCGGDGQCNCPALKSRSQYDSDSFRLRREQYSYPESGSESENCRLTDSESDPNLTNCPCKNLDNPNCLKSEYYYRNYLESSLCSKSSYYRHWLRAKNDSKFARLKHYIYSDAGCVSFTANEENQGNDSETSIPSEMKSRICDVTSKSGDDKEILVSENEYYQSNSSENPDCWETKYYEGNDGESHAASDKEYFQGRDPSSEGSCMLNDDKQSPPKTVQIQGAGEEEENNSNSKRKRGLSPDHECSKPKKKKVHNVGYEPKSVFHPVLDHRYWCLWKICTGDTSGVSDVQRPGWKFYVDAVIDGCTQRARIGKRQVNDVLKLAEERERLFKCLDAISDLGRY